MEIPKASQIYSLAMAVALMALVIQSARGQVAGSSCSASMITSFTPCLGFLSNSSANGTSPTADCCSALKSLLGSGTNCLCQMVTGAVPFRVPINRTLALPRACSIAGVPISCKAISAPIPAPGPTAFIPAFSPTAAASPPTAAAIPKSASPALAPETDPAAAALTPPSPTSTTGSSSPLIPSSASDYSPNLSQALVLFSVTALLVKYY
ncbi:hypothetical protein Nepgr_020674 [Nepenthes gracilis]|uniref:Bifunctional inhibitor/plant lipid transfer protein/seed storage helical domain-containing protein n=1 Tax=Nepenthes gracilis TaxID=150966 RepID=A0AAD3SWM1_NEPGR|nr:hypothetical protein Nepgr_020674 [Nepenthes gracilis]